MRAGLFHQLSPSSLAAFSRILRGKKIKPASRRSPAGVKAKASRLLIISTGAGSITPEIERKLREVFADHLIVPFDPDDDFTRLITPRAQVVVAGGDGSIEFVVRKLADTNHPLAILSLGTFNNFALSLGLPTDLDQQIRVAKTGRPRAITLGRVNGRVFIEACAIGLFGETIALGESAKDREYGAFVQDLRNVVRAKRFKYELEGDLSGSGVAMSLLFANTASTGARLPVGDGMPTDRYLEFSVHAGKSRTDIAARAVASALLMKHKEDAGQVFKFRSLTVKTAPKVKTYADNMLVGPTPATVTAETSALKVVLPRTARRVRSTSTA